MSSSLLCDSISKKNRTFLLIAHIDGENACSFFTECDLINACIDCVNINKVLMPDMVFRRDYDFPFSIKNKCFRADSL